MSRYKIFTHTDLDGVGCAILAYLAFGRENVDVEYCNYDDVDEKIESFIEQEELFKSYHRVFITDISISRPVANMIDILDRSKRVELFDHHATAYNLNKYDWCDVRVFYDPDNPACKTSGTEMLYDHLDQYSYFDAFNYVTRKNIIRFVEIVRDYDTWRWKEELGDEGIIYKQVNDLFYIYGRDEFIDWAMYQILGIGSISYRKQRYP